MDPTSVDRTGDDAGVRTHPGDGRLRWWRITLALCAAVIALSSLVIARAEMNQAEELRKANCLPRAQASGTGSADQLEDCLGLPTR